jgi:uncharacterized protein (TIGR00297 family)
MLLALTVPMPGGPLWMAALVTLAFAALARAVRGVSWSGAAAGGMVCFVLYAAAGVEAFALLALVFLLTWAATRIGYQRKLRLGTAEKKSGRTAAQVFANVGVAAMCAGAYALRNHDPAFLLGLSASLSEAAADTVSSELGQAFSQRARLITNWKEVPAGTDGGISLFGTSCGMVAGGVVSLAAVLTGLVPRNWWALSAGAAIAAMIADSFLGAILERRGWLNNNGVNFLSTLLAAGICLALVTGQRQICGLPHEHVLPVFEAFPYPTDNGLSSLNCNPCI